VPWFRTETQRVADAFDVLSKQYRRLVRQLDLHAQTAPYPQVGDRLRELLAAASADRQTVVQRLAALGRRASENGSEDVRGGRNSWERLIADLEEYRALVRNLSELELRWHDHHPDDAQLLHGLREAAVRHRDAIVDLIARSDPHAID
jgi:hypothetical protein